MKTINLFWSAGQHATDLQRRGILDNIQPNLIEIWDTHTNIEWHPHVFCIPISSTKQAIERICTHPTWEIINFSGIMSTTPEDLPESTQVSNFHFLFWPKAENGLKTVFAWELSPTTSQIIENCRKLWIEVIESSVEEHDKKMAVVQALSHTTILLSWIWKHIDNPLLQEWNTPNSTIADMICENKFFKPILEKLQVTLSKWWNVSDFFIQIVSEELTPEDIQNFWTPTFLRILKFCTHNSIEMNKKMVTCLDLFTDKQNISELIFHLKSIPNMIKWFKQMNIE